MLRFLSKYLKFMLCAIFCVSCGFIDLRPIEIIIEPGETDSLLGNFDSPLIVKFNTEMVKEDAEGIMQISSDMGIMDGDFSWTKNDLYFTPVPGWTAGIRYTLSLFGTMRSVDGRELRIEKFVSFYTMNKNERPLLIWHSPADGASVGTGNQVFEFHFSRSMDKLTVESALSIEGIGNKIYEWLSDDKVLKVSSDKSLTPWMSYRWNLRDSAKSVDGVPLPKTYTGYFTTSLDKILPKVIKVFPVLFSDGSWYPTGSNLETGLAPDQGIAIEFNKPMSENVLRSIRFEPSLTGRTEMLSENSIIYIFTKDPESEITYIMIVSADARDTEGLKTGEEYRINFFPDIPFFNVLSFSSIGSPLADNIYSDIVLPARITPGTGDFLFFIRFSLPFNRQEKQNTALKVMLTPFFPKTLAPVALQNVDWFSDDQLLMCWEGLTAGDDDTRHYYRLTIPGGKNGITNGIGMYMKEDITIYLEAVND
jgi:hypothetical protein